MAELSLQGRAELISNATILPIKVLKDQYTELKALNIDAEVLGLTRQADETRKLMRRIVFELDMRSEEAVTADWDPSELVTLPH